MFYRTLQRQLAAHMNDTFGTREQHPRTTASLARQDRNQRRQARLATKVKQALCKYRHGSLHLFLTTAISGTPRRRTPQMQPDEHLDLDIGSLHALDWAERAWLHQAMDDLNTVLRNTLVARTEYEDYMQTRGIVINVEQHERRRRAHSLILGTLWALLYEMKRVSGCMLQLAQETIQYTVGFEML